MSIKVVVREQCKVCNGKGVRHAKNCPACGYPVSPDKGFQPVSCGSCGYDLKSSDLCSDCSGKGEIEYTIPFANFRELLLTGAK